MQSMAHYGFSPLGRRAKTPKAQLQISASGKGAPAPRGLYPLLTENVRTFTCIAQPIHDDLARQDLRRWRTGLAKRVFPPPFMICHGVELI